MKIFSANNVISYLVSILVVSLIIISGPAQAYQIVNVNVNKKDNNSVSISTQIIKESQEIIKEGDVYALLDGTVQSSEVISCYATTAFDSRIEDNESMFNLPEGAGYLNGSNGETGTGYGYGYGAQGSGEFVCTFNFTDMPEGEYQNITTYINGVQIGTKEINLSIEEDSPEVIVGDKDNIEASEAFELLINGKQYDEEKSYEGRVEVKILNNQGTGLIFQHNLDESILNLSEVKLNFSEYWLGAEGFTGEATYVIAKNPDHTDCNIRISPNQTSLNGDMDWISYDMDKVTETNSYCYVNGITGTVVQDYNEKPRAIIDGKANIEEGDILELDGVNSQDSDGYLEHYRWYLDNELISSGSSLDKVLEPGEYNFRLVVEDNGGLTDEAHFTVDVSEKEEEERNYPSDLTIKSVRISEYVSSSSPEITASLNIENNLNKDFDRGSFSIYIPALGIYSKQDFELEEGKEKTVLHQIYPEMDIPKGDYDVIFKISNDEFSRTKHRMISFV